MSYPLFRVPSVLDAIYDVKNLCLALKGLTDIPQMGSGGTRNPAPRPVLGQ
jgi:hypothetical protein